MENDNGEYTQVSVALAQEDIQHVKGLARTCGGLPMSTMLRFIIYHGLGWKDRLPWEWLSDGQTDNDSTT